MDKVSMSHLFSISRYQTKCVIELLFRQLITSWILRFIFDHPLKQWPTSRKRGKEFLKAPFLVLHFSYYTLMTFLMMLSVILQSMLMILLSVLSVIGHLICGNNLNWLLNLNLIYETQWTGARSGLLISMLGKLSWFHLTGIITMVLLMWKWVGLFLRKNHRLRY